MKYFIIYHANPQQISPALQTQRQTIELKQKKVTKKKQQKNESNGQNNGNIL